MTDKLTPEQGFFLIVKRGLYYRPEDKGYTGIKDDAARYTLDEVAVRFPNFDSPNQDGLEFIAEADAADYSKACWPETKAANEIKKRDDIIASQAAEIKLLREGLKEILDLEKIPYPEASPSWIKHVVSMVRDILKNSNQ